MSNNEIINIERQFKSEYNKYNQKQNFIRVT